MKQCCSLSSSCSCNLAHSPQNCPLSCNNNTLPDRLSILQHTLLCMYHLVEILVSTRWCLCPVRLRADSNCQEEESLYWWWWWLSSALLSSRLSSWWSTWLLNLCRPGRPPQSQLLHPNNSTSQDHRCILQCTEPRTSLMAERLHCNRWYLCQDR